MIWDDIGFLLNKNRYNENSLISEIYTKNFGKVSGIIFGGTSKKINLDKYILTLDIKKKKNKIEDKVVSDCCEALIGSIYLDKGFNSVEKFILELWSENIKDSVITQIDAKTKLQEFSLKRFKKLPIYKLISNTGPRHKPLFKVGVKLVDTKFFLAEGNSKKDAEQNAAIKCLQNQSKL